MVNASEIKPLVSVQRDGLFYAHQKPLYQMTGSHQYLQFSRNYQQSDCVCICIGEIKTN